MRPPPLNLLGLAPLARPPGWCQLPPTLGCPPGPGGVSTDLQAVLVETSKATPAAVGAQESGDVTDEFPGGRRAWHDGRSLGSSPWAGVLVVTTAYRGPQPSSSTV